MTYVACVIAFVDVLTTSSRGLSARVPFTGIPMLVSRVVPAGRGGGTSVGYESYEVVGVYEYVGEEVASSTGWK